MSSGEELAVRFTEANAEATKVVLGPAARHWHAVTPAEGWPVGVTARHIALGHDLMLGWLEALSRGRPVEGIAEVDERNAEVAAKGVVAEPSEVAQALSARGSAVANALRALPEHRLAGEVVFGGRSLPAIQLAEAAIRHIEVHMESIRRALESESTA
jgi:DinB family protein